MVAVSLKKNFFKQKTAYEINFCLVGSEMCIRDSVKEDWTTTITTLNGAGLLQEAKDPAEYWDSSFAPDGQQ